MTHTPNKPQGVSPYQSLRPPYLPLFILLGIAFAGHTYLAYNWIRWNVTFDWNQPDLLQWSWLALHFLIFALYLKWLHRASSNLRSITSHRVKHTPKQAILWTLIPGLNLILPYTAYLEISDISLKRIRSMELVTGWWICWLIFFITFLLQFKSFKPRVEDVVIYAHLLSGIFFYPSFMVLLFRITRGQFRRSRYAAKPSEYVPNPGEAFKPLSHRIKTQQSN